MHILLPSTELLKYTEDIFKDIEEMPSGIVEHTEQICVANSRSRCHIFFFYKSEAKKYLKPRFFFFFFFFKI